MRVNSALADALVKKAELIAEELGEPYASEISKILCKELLGAKEKGTITDSGWTLILTRFRTYEKRITSLRAQRATQRNG